MMEVDTTVWPTDHPAGQTSTEAAADDDFLNLPPEGQKCLEEFWNSLPLEGKTYKNINNDYMFKLRRVKNKNT